MIQKILNEEHHLLQVRFSSNQTVAIQVCVSVCVRWCDRLKISLVNSRMVPCAPGAVRLRTELLELQRGTRRQHQGPTAAMARRPTPALWVMSCLRQWSACRGPEWLCRCRGAEATLTISIHDIKSGFLSVKVREWQNREWSWEQ